MLDGWPARVVICDDHHRWRVLGSQMHRIADERTARWEELLELDPSLAALPALTSGSAAYRSGPGLPWTVFHG